MADELEIAKDSLEVLSGVFELSSTFSQVSTIIKFSGGLASAFPVVGAILGLIGALLPDVKHQEIISRLKDLSRKIDQVRGDIQDLKYEIRWDITEARYGDAVDRIELGIEYCLEIAKASGKDEKIRYQERLKRLCANENYALALKTLLDGMTGNGLYQSSSILDKFYDKTGGNRPRISALATRLLQLVSGGMMAISTYETMIHGKKGAEDVSKFFYRRLNDAADKVQSILDKCMNNFKGNMLLDLNVFLDTGRSNRDLSSEVINFMRDKYDWLENFCLIYNDLNGFDKHIFNGDRVSSLHRNGKCGIVFYRTKGEPPKFSNRYDEAYKIVQSVGRDRVQKGFNNIVAKMGASKIGWSGCAVITRGPDLWFGGTFSNKTISVVGKKHTAILLLK